MLPAHENSIAELNYLLKTEWSAAQIYKRVKEAAPDQYIRLELAAVRLGHDQRARLLEERVTALGGQPDHGRSHFDTVGQMIDLVLSTVGEKVAIMALEEEESRSLQDYSKRLAGLDEDSRRLVVQTLLPAQKQTKSMLTALRKKTA